MLRKEICIKCWRNVIQWNNGDEDRWDRRLVSCPRVYSGLDLSRMEVSIETIPKWCPYKFEQAVGGGMTDVQ